MTLGEKIYKYRKQAGLSQEELAYKMNVSRQSVSLWETDQTTPSLESLIMLSEIFSVSLDELCGTPVKSAEPAASRSPESEESLVCVQTKYTPELVKHINNVDAKKYYIIWGIGIFLSVCIGVGILISEADKFGLFLPILLFVVFTAKLIQLRLSLEKRTADFFTFCSNGIVTVNFFNDYFTVKSASDKSDSTATVRYGDIKNVVNSDKCILIYYGNSVVPIEKNLPDTNYDLILKLLSVAKDETKVDANNNTKAPQNKKIRILLLIMFILSLLSIVFALIAFVYSEDTSVIPDFPFDIKVNFWVFFIFIPLPLISVILGIVFSTKNYKYIKNIIAGSIVSLLLFGFGSFSFLIEDDTLHDFDYVHEIEQTVEIDLPDSGYISRAIDKGNMKSSFAMIKFDEKNEILEIVSTDTRFTRDINAIPSKYLTDSYSSVASDYHYFMLFDATIGETVVETHIQAEEHRFIFIAYHIDKNILLVIDFIK